MKQNYNRIKSVLAEKNKTNTWLAEALQVNINTVSKWCTNKSQPAVETLFTIAVLLDMDVRELLVSNNRSGPPQEWEDVFQPPT